MSVKGTWKRVAASEEEYGGNHDAINRDSKRKTRKLGNGRRVKGVVQVKLEKEGK